MTAQAPHIFLRILIPFCTGSAVLSQLSFTKLNSVITIYVIFLFFTLLVINLLYKPIKAYHHKELIAIGINLLFLLMGIWCLNRNDPGTKTNYFSNSPAAYFKVMIADEPQQRGSFLKLKAKIITKYISNKKIKTSGNIMLIIRLDPAASSLVNYGQVYLIPARYTAVEPPSNPAEFDLRSWLSNQQIHDQSFLSAEEMIPCGTDRGNAIIGFALALRKRQVNLYRKLIKQDEAFAVAATLILGYRSDLDAETLAAYSKTGTIHALSVSGMHVGIIYIVLNFSLKWMDRKRILKWSKLILILALIWFYTLLTGYSASVLRSAIMLSVFILSKAFQRQTTGYHILASSAFLLLFYNPFLLWDVGFQLSYMAVFGLIWLQPIVFKLLYFRHSWLSKLWNLISLSIAAQVLTFPFSVYYFHQFPVYFIISNLFIALPVALLMYAGIAILLFRLYWLAPAFEWLIVFMNKGLEKIAALPYSSINQIWLTKTELVLIILIFITLSRVAKRKQFIYWSLLLTICLQGMLVKDKLWKMRQKQTLLFTLKRHYAAAFIQGKRAILITDLQPADKPFRFHIQPALDQLRITEVICMAFDQDTVLNGFIKKDHQLLFGAFKVLLVDSSFNRKRISGKPVYDVVWLHGSPKINIHELREDLKFGGLWIDATNKGYLVKKYRETTPPE